MTKDNKNIGTLPPQNIEAEIAVLGAIMIEKDSINKVLNILKPESFYKEPHSIVYNTCLKLYKKNDPIDLLTVSSELRKTNELDRVGGAIYLAELTECISSASNLETHARLISECAIKREMIKMCSQVIKKCYDPLEDVIDTLQELEGNVLKTSQVFFTKSAKTMKDLIPEIIKETEENMNRPDGVTGIISGYTSIDSLTGGWQRGELIILAARPAMGKTAIAANFAVNPFKLKDMTVLIFSLEMNNKSIARRIISLESKVKASSMSKGSITQDDFKKINDSIGNIYTDKIIIDDDASPTILQIRSKSLNCKLEKGLDMVIVDYLQLARGDDRNKGNREQEIASISRGLKAMAKELNIPVMALSQLTRGVEQRGGDKRPVLSDLRESGAIEQDADVVMFLHRPEYYGIDKDEAGYPTKGMAELIFAKHRNGALDTIKLGCQLSINRFYDLDTDQTESIPEWQTTIFPPERDYSEHSTNNEIF